jgi:hypothetical protein
MVECGLTGEVEESRRDICLCDTTSTKKLTRKETDAQEADAMKVYVLLQLRVMS